MNWMTFKKLLIVINASPTTAVYCKELLAKLQLSESNFSTHKKSNKQNDFSTVSQVLYILF